MNKKIIIILVSFLFTLTVLFSETAAANQAVDSQKNTFFLQTSLLTRHWDSDPDTNNSQQLIGLEYQLANSHLYGVSYFKNSAFQPSWYLYRGKIFHWQQIRNFKLYGKLTYGVVTGYDDQGGRYRAVWYKLGTFPAVLPSVGIKYKAFALETSFFANQGVIVHAGVKF